MKYILYLIQHCNLLLGIFLGLYLKNTYLKNTYLNTYLKNTYLKEYIIESWHLFYEIKFLFSFFENTWSSKHFYLGNWNNCYGKIIGLWKIGNSRLQKVMIVFGSSNNDKSLWLKDFKGFPQHSSWHIISTKWTF